MQCAMMRTTQEIQRNKRREGGGSEDEGLPQDMKLEITVEETWEVMMEGRAREKRRAEEARWGPIPQLGHRPKEELKEGREMEKTLQV